MAFAAQFRVWSLKKMETPLVETALEMKVGIKIKTLGNNRKKLVWVFVFLIESQRKMKKKNGFFFWDEKHDKR